MFRKEGSGEWAAQIATGAQPVLLGTTVSMPIQTWARSRYWGLRIPWVIAEGWVDYATHAHLVSI